MDSQHFEFSSCDQFVEFSDVACSGNAGTLAPSTSNMLGCSVDSLVEYVDYGAHYPVFESGIVSRSIVMTQGNIENSNIYLTTAIDLFPDDVFGGPNETEAAASIIVDWGSESIATDIVKEKNTFRKRGWVRTFFLQQRVAAGDHLLLERIEPYVFRLSKLQQD